MTANWIAVLEPWWPMLAAAAVGLLLGWLLRGRRRTSEAESRADGRPESEAAAVQGKLAETTPFPVRPPVDAAPEGVVADVAPEVTSKGDTLEAFAQFESKLREWQTYASSEAAVQATDQPSIDDWDDLMDIDGIDLGLARFLYAEGIHTFDQIAAMTPAELRAVLDRAGSIYVSVDPSPWPESAQRAALAR
jgi:predicted flap endonuclease-1-like 5' DNA nuclease